MQPGQQCNVRLSEALERHSITERGRTGTCKALTCRLFAPPPHATLLLRAEPIPETDQAAQLAAPAPASTSQFLRPNRWTQPVFPSPLRRIISPPAQAPPAPDILHTPHQPHTYETHTQTHTAPPHPTCCHLSSMSAIISMNLASSAVGAQVPAAVVAPAAAAGRAQGQGEGWRDGGRGERRQ